MDGAFARVRRAARRGRREAADLRSPHRTVLRWVAVGTRGEVTFGQPGRTLDDQPPDRVTVGDGVVLGDHVTFHLGPAGRVEIGAGAVLGAHVTVAADDLVRIGPGCRIGPYAVLSDTWSYGRTASGPVPAPPPEPVALGADVELGVRAVVGPGVALPPGSVVAAGAVLHAGVGAP